MPSSVSVDQLCALLLQQFERADYQPPPLPDVAAQLMVLCSQPSVSAIQIVSLLERDPMLAASVLRLVRTPLYAGRTPVSSLGDAVVRLGINLIRDIVFEVSLRQGVFNLPEFREVMSQLNRHSLVSAYLARVLCRHLRIDASEAFVCALLHDVGFAGLMIGISEQRGFSGPDALVSSWSAIDRAHEAASGKLAAIWGLPSVVIQVIGHHHHFEEAGDHQRLAAVVQLAESLAGDFGADVLGPTLVPGTAALADRSDENAETKAKSALGITDELQHRIHSEMERLIPTILWV